MADLREVERARKQQTPLVDFVAGAHDQLRRLHVSQKLYGREDEVRRLTHNFELVCEGSPMMATLVLVHGYSGVIHASPRFFLLFLLFMLIPNSGWQDSSRTRSPQTSCKAIWVLR